MTNPLFDDQSNIDNTPDQEGVDYSTELIGEGKKYRDQQAAAKALLEKDRFIERLKAENAEARAALRGEAKMDEFLEKLRAAQNSGTASTSAHQQGETSTNQNQNNQTPPKALSIDEVQNLLNERDRAAAEAANLASVTQKLREAYGANYKANMSAKAEELGMSQDSLLNLAKTQPRAFLKLVEADQVQQSRGVPPNTSINTAATQRKAGNEKNNEYYRALRKQIGDAEFFKPSVQNQLHKDAQRLGEAFYN